ncbi:MAG: hypothetical protein PHE27_00015 [Alphaproteobacteria bacterium]|nr:hypothetical protein [Alphaproteobacteria bacterium]
MTEKALPDSCREGLFLTLTPSLLQKQAAWKWKTGIRTLPLRLAFFNVSMLMEHERVAFFPCINRRILMSAFIIKINAATIDENKGCALSHSENALYLTNESFEVSQIEITRDPFTDENSSRIFRPGLLITRGKTSYFALDITARQFDRDITDYLRVNNHFVRMDVTQDYNRKPSEGDGPLAQESERVYAGRSVSGKELKAAYRFVMHNTL